MIMDLDGIQQEGANPMMPLGGAEEPVSEEQEQILASAIEQLKQKLGNFNAVQFASGSKTERMRSDLLRQVFEKLQLAGVDLTSRESVSAFIARLRERSPELAQLFEESMNALLGELGEEPPVVAPQESLGQNMNNENNNENAAQILSQDLR